MSADLSGPPAIETAGLVKAYGDHRALDGLDLVVEPGSIFGFLGANGAGKTTTQRILLGLARQTAGSAQVLGHAPGSAAVRSQIGFCPDVPAFLPWMTGREVLEHAAELFGLDAATTRTRVGELLELVGLAGVKSRVGGYSRGMRQRLGLGQALINAPALLMLDEPTSALDPLGRRDVLALLSELRGRTTVFFSTHLLPDVERVCDTVAILDHGRVVTSGSLDHVRSAIGGVHGRLLVEVDDAAALRAALAGEPWVLDAADRDDESAASGGVVVAEAPGELVLTVTDLDEAAARLPALVTTHGLLLRRLEPRAPSLEDVFVATTSARPTEGALR